MLIVVADHPEDLDRLEESCEEILRDAICLLRRLPHLLCWRVAPDNICTSLSSDWYALTGRDVGNSVGTGWSEAVHPDDIELLWSDYLRGRAALVSATTCYRLRRADGTYVRLVSYNAPHYDHGVFVGYVGLAVPVEPAYNQPMLSKARRGAVSTTPRGREKMHQTMQEFKSGELHSGSKKGPLVRNRKQAIAIGLSQARRAK
jgi:hypothetical protein